TESGSSPQSSCRASCSRTNSARSGSPCSSSQSARTRRGVSSNGSSLQARSSAGRVVSMLLLGQATSPDQRQRGCTPPRGGQQPAGDVRQGLPPLAIHAGPFGAKNQQPLPVFRPEGAGVNSQGREPLAAPIAIITLTSAAECGGSSLPVRRSPSS